MEYLFPPHYTNAIVISGTIIEEPTVKAFQTGTKLTTFRLAAEHYKVRNSAAENNSFALKVDIFGDRADLRSGMRVAVFGKLAEETWTTRDGQKRGRIVIKASTVAAVDPPPVARVTAASAPEPEEDNPYDDIPF